MSKPLFTDGDWELKFVEELNMGFNIVHTCADKRTWFCSKKTNKCFRCNKEAPDTMKGLRHMTRWER